MNVRSWPGGPKAALRHEPAPAGTVATADLTDAA